MLNQVWLVCLICFLYSLIILSDAPVAGPSHKLNYADIYSSSEEDDDLPCQKPIINDYVLVRLEGKKCTKHFIAVVLKENDQEFEVKFLKRVGGNKFIFPNVEDFSIINFVDVVSVLKQPSLDNRERYVFNLEKKHFGLQIY